MYLVSPPARVSVHTCTHAHEHLSACICDFSLLYCTNSIELLVRTWRREIELYSCGYRGDVVKRTKDGTRRFICLVFLRGIRERAGDTWYPYRHHHLIEAKQSDETNKREGMRAPFPLAFVVSPSVLRTALLLAYIETLRTPSFLVVTFASDPLIPISEDRIPVQT